MTLNNRPMKLQRFRDRCLPAHVARMILDVMKLHILQRGHGFHSHGGTPKWMVYSGRSYKKWMIRGSPHFRKPLYMETLEIIVNYSLFWYKKAQMSSMKHMEPFFQQALWVAGMQIL